MNGCHVENLSWFASRKPAICLIGASSSLSSSSEVFKLEIIGFQSEKAVCGSGNFSSEFLNVVGLQKSNFKFLPISVLSSSLSSEK